MPESLEPTREDHFTFGLWTVGNPGRDPFGHETRLPLDAVDTVHRLADLGAYGVSLQTMTWFPGARRPPIVKPSSSASDTL